MGNGQQDDNKPQSGSNVNTSMDVDVQNEIAGMAIKLQPFWTESPENWFLLAEIQFKMQKVTAESQRYLQTLAAIPSSIHDRISDLLRAPPTENPYTTLKNTLLNRLAPSDEKQLEKLLSGQEIGDRCPSEVLRHIRELARDNFPDKIIRSLWSRKMPEIIRIAVAAQPDTTPTNALAETADRMFEAMSAGQNHQLAPINRQSRSREASSSTNSGRGEYRTPSSNRSNSLEDRVARIEAKLDRIAHSSRSRSRSQSSNRRFLSQSRFGNRSRSRSASRVNNRQHNICWYHQKFGSSARKCNKPCEFGQSTSAMDVDASQKNY